jgi:hypothetical protein
MSDSALFKPEKDYTKEADKILPEAEALAKVGHSRGLRILDSNSVIERHPERH